MKNFIIISAILLLVCLFLSETYADANSDRIIKECLAESGITHEALKKTKFDDPKMKCLMTCMLTKDKTIIDGKISTEKLKIILFMSENMDDVTKESYRVCTKLANQQDGCEVGFTYMKCINEKLSKGKISVGEKSKTDI